MIKFFIFTALSLPLLAADFYLSPKGAGTADGSSRENAAPPAKADALFNETLKPGDRLLLLPGIYEKLEITLASSGTADAPKTLAGVVEDQKKPTLKSTWELTSKKTYDTAIRLAEGVSHLRVENLHLSHYTFAVKADSSAKQARENVTFTDLDIDHVRHSFYLSDFKKLTLKNIKTVRYRKHAYRFEEGCVDVLVENCLADCSEGDPTWEAGTELFPFGFTARNSKKRPNSKFRFIDCAALNNVMPRQDTKYRNGDGFVIENAVEDVSFLRCRAQRNQDGGYDLKSPNVTLRDCIATHNGRDFRIWYGGTLENCFAGFSYTGLWNNGPGLTASHCTLYGHKVSAMSDDRATDQLVIKDSLLVDLGQHEEYEAKRRKTTLENCEIIRPKDEENDPKFVNPTEKWFGEGDNFDSRTFPDKGYSSTRVSK
ncbi:MAG: right-handed parallel beta-helix repeat-containing protein [Verrucomicrobiales bacterium]